MEHLLEVKNLSVSIDGPAGEVQAVRDVSFSLKKGEVLAIVGESGCGKSVLCKSIMKLLPPSAKIKEGSICVNGQDINGWFIGFVENTDNTYFFATNIHHKTEATGGKAAEITLSILSDLNIWK